MDYKAYLQSDHWKELRARAIDRWGACCNHCKAPWPDVHHLRYGTLYDVTTEDLIPLCRKCHDKVHESDALKEISKAASSEGRRMAVKAYLLGRDHEGRKKRLKLEKKAKKREERLVPAVQRVEQGKRTVTLTKNNLMALRSDRGGITGPVVHALGYKSAAELPRGWFKALRGKTILEEDYFKALSVRNLKTHEENKLDKGL